MICYVPPFMSLSSSNENKDKFRIQNNYVTSLKQSSIKMYLDIRYSSDNYRRNPSQFWSTIEPLFNDNLKSNSHINLREGDDVITNNEKVCNIFNDYYVNVTNDIGEDECVYLNGSLCDIVNMYANHHSILVIKENLVDSDSNFEFHAVNSDVLFKKLTA